MGRFTNKVIIITGASSGIGRALALQMAEKNAHLVLTSRRPDELKPVAEACSAKGAICTSLYIDMEVPATIDAFTAKIKSQFKTVDVLINNAGISQRSKAEATNIEVDRKIMEVNFFGPVYLTKSLWPLLSLSSHANVVLMSSVVGTFGFPLRSAYSASKHALEGFFESWMLENKQPNISFTTIAPGRIKTNISRAALTADGSSHQQMDPGLERGISAESCARKIIDGIVGNKRKVYVAQNEMVLIALRKCFPYLYFKIAKKINPV
jgi:dehydrogenase/reductase SDR family member 7B